MTSLQSVIETTWGEEARRVARMRLRRATRRAAVSLGKIVGIVGLIGAGLGLAILCVPEAPRTLAEPATGTEWREVRRPLPLYGLTGTDFARLALDYAARRNDVGARRDRLTFGSLQDDAGWLRLDFYRRGTEDAPTEPALAAFAALVRDLGAGISNMAAATVMQTRFGPFEAMELNLDAPEGATPCLGFRGVPADGVLRISGLACGAAGRPVGRDLLACIIDRIDLLSAGDDADLRRQFTDAERRRGNTCAPVSPLQAGSHTSWLDAHSSPPMLKP